MNMSPRRARAPGGQAEALPFLYHEAAGSTSRHDLPQTEDAGKGESEVAGLAAQEVEREVRARDLGRQQGERESRAKFEERLAGERSAVAQALTDFARERAAYYRKIEEE